MRHASRIDHETISKEIRVVCLVSKLKGHKKQNKIAFKV